MAEEKEILEEKEQETRMRDLSRVLKSEMDDARDFIQQVGEERAESTEYYLGNEPEPTSTLQSYYRARGCAARRTTNKLCKLYCPGKKPWLFYFVRCV